MKKSIVALAVTSSAFASISAYAAEDVTVSSYGAIALMYQNVGQTGAASENGFADDGSNFGFKGESKISDTTSAFFNIKYKVKADEQYSYGVSGIKMNNAQVGVKGNFGKAQVGSFDSVYNDAVQDGFDQSESLNWAAGTTNSGKSGNTIAYFSPSMNGLSFAVSMQKNGTKGYSQTDQSKAGVSTTSGAGRITYATDMFTVSVGGDQNKGSSTQKSTSGIKVAVMPVTNLTLAVKYEKEADTASYTAVNATYNYGMGTVFSTYQRVKPESGSSASIYELGGNYSLNSSVYVFAEVGSDNFIGGKKVDNAQVTTNVGVVYSF